MMVSSVLVATSFPVGAAITHGLDSLVLTFLRFLLAALLFAPVIAWRYRLTWPGWRSRRGTSTDSGQRFRRRRRPTRKRVGFRSDAPVRRSRTSLIPAAPTARSPAVAPRHVPNALLRLQVDVHDRARGAAPPAQLELAPPPRDPPYLTESLVIGPRDSVACITYFPRRAYSLCMAKAADTSVHSRSWWKLNRR